MKLLALTCSHCGAPLEARAGTRFLTCGFCSTRLRIISEGNAHFTEILEALEERTDALEKGTGEIADDVEKLKIKDEIRDLDARWTEERTRYMNRLKDGRLSVPSVGTTLVFAVVIGLVGLFIAVNSRHVSSIAPIVAAGFVVLTIFVAMGNIGKAKAYARAHSSYQSQRRELSRLLQT